jgi:peptide/nickel transport system permease protein
MTTRWRLIFLILPLAALHAAVFFAGFLAPYNVASQNRALPFAPPTRIHFFDSGGHLTQPFFYSWKPREGGLAEYDEDRSQPFPVNFFLRGDHYRLAGFVPCERHLFGTAAPSQISVLGTDAFGRDVFSRALYGGQVSLLAGLFATCLTVVVGGVLGALAGFYGGWLDDILMRAADLFLALPWLYLLFAVRAFLPLQIEPIQAFMVLVSVIGLVGWAKPARLVRGMFLSVRESNFVHAARGFGASDFYIIRRHVLPEASGVILTQVTLLLPQYVMAEITLSFLGLGIGEPVPTWGNMLNVLMQTHVLRHYWWMIAPGLITIPFFLGYHLLGTALDEHAAKA